MSERLNEGRPDYVPDVEIGEFDYELPPDRIAERPLAQREASRLLVCDATSGAIEHRSFREITSLIPSDAMMIVNDTRVVRARIVLRKETGGRVEIFLLEPIEPSADPAIALASRGESVWAAMIGGARKIRDDVLITSFDVDGQQGELRLAIEGRLSDGFRVRLQWTPSVTLAELLESLGRVPLPPYIKREADDSDIATYQTVYAEHEGAVAAPTAGLHFTPEIFDALRSKGVTIERVTLHVGAGTFKQVQSTKAAEHQMHGERLIVSSETLQHLIDHAKRRESSNGSPIVLVGTTSLRTVESLYWFGVRVINGEGGDEMEVEQWDPYRLAAARELPLLSTSLEAVDHWRREHRLDHVAGRTSLMIVPGYTFRACDALVTNFHQPGSTLILLVGAILGRDLWRRVYDEAMQQGYRWLSYGDSSLLTLNATRMKYI